MDVTATHLDSAFPTVSALKTGTNVGFALRPRLPRTSESRRALAAVSHMSRQTPLLLNNATAATSQRAEIQTLKAESSGVRARTPSQQTDGRSWCLLIKKKGLRYLGPMRRRPQAPGRGSGLGRLMRSQTEDAEGLRFHQQVSDFDSYMKI